jgi:hypothetical protein
MVEPTQQYSYRDLGIIQDFRRQYLDPHFAAGTNDLAMALRFYNLRRQSAANPVLSGKLDAIFTDIVNGNIKDANLALEQLER